jgi:hypothetical protein
MAGVDTGSISVAGSTTNGTGNTDLLEELGFALLGLSAGFTSKAGIALLSEMLDVARELVNKGSGNFERHKRKELRR